MTLKEALKTYLNSMGYYSASKIFFGVAHGQADCLVIRDNGEHNFEATRFKMFPQINLYLRGKQDQRAATEAKIWELFGVVDKRMPANFSGYKVSRVEAAGHPIDLGQDLKGNWQWTLNVNFTVPTNQYLTNGG